MRPRRCSRVGVGVCDKVANTPIPLIVGCVCHLNLCRLPRAAPTRGGVYGFFRCITFLPRLLSCRLACTRPPRVMAVHCTRPTVLCGSRHVERWIISLNGHLLPNITLARRRLIETIKLMCTQYKQYNFSIATILFTVKCVFIFDLL